MRITAEYDRSAGLLLLRSERGFTQLRVTENEAIAIAAVCDVVLEFFPHTPATASFR